MIPSLVLSTPFFGTNPTQRNPQPIKLQLVNITSSAAQNCFYLFNYEYQTEIIKFLDLKSLKCFRSVCKNWNQGVSKLRKLKLVSKRLRDRDLSILSKLELLNEFSSSHSKITEVSFGYFTPQNLQKLSLTNCENICTFTALTTLTNLSMLNLSNGKLSDLCMKHLAPLTKLHTLILKRLKISHVGVEHLSSLMGLKYLNLSHCYYLGNDAIKKLQPLTNLQTLYLSSCNLTDGSVVYLSSLTSLENLYFSANRLDKTETIRQFESLTNLKRLDLSRCGTTKSGDIKFLSSLKQLNYLNISHGWEDAQTWLEIQKFTHITTLKHDKLFLD